MIREIPPAVPGVSFRSCKDRYERANITSVLRDGGRGYIAGEAGDTGAFGNVLSWKQAFGEYFMEE